MKLAVLVLFGSSVAAAEPPRFALAINSPVGWGSSRYTDGPALAVAGSAYVGIGDRHALRVNVASYELLGYAAFVGDAFVAAVGGEPGECTTAGRVGDIGIGWMYFLRKRWAGPSFELGLVGRRRAWEECMGIEPYVGVDATTMAILARPIAGWSWLVSDHVYISIAGGFSVGREWGRETRTTADDTAPARDVTSNVHRFTGAPELFARIGWAFL